MKGIVFLLTNDDLVPRRKVDIIVLYIRMALRKGQSNMNLSISIPLRVSYKEEKILKLGIYLLLSRLSY